MSEIKELIEQIKILNSHFAEMFPSAPTMSRKQVMAKLGVTTGTVTNYKRKYGKEFQICRNEFSTKCVKQIKARREGLA